LFDDVASGIKHFAAITGVKADTLPSPEIIEEIRKEEETLPLLDWLPGYPDDVAARTWEQRGVALLAKTGGFSFGGFSAPKNPPQPVTKRQPPPQTAYTRHLQGAIKPTKPR
jgi:hypothetical protein